MKPRIRLWRKVWDCRLPDWMTTNRIGFGFTPQEAYAEWMRQAYRQRPRRAP